MTYRRGGVTWAVFAGLFAFGLLNAGLGPALPYIRAHEHISYLAGVLHQVAFAVGGGAAGLLAARSGRWPSRAVAIRCGMTGAALAWLGVGYGGTLAVTATAALLVSLFATSALIRMWAVLADEHGERRTVAMTEGEVSVSLGGIVAPLLIGGLAASQLGWRAAFAAGAVMTVGAVLAGAFTMLPAPPPRPAGPPSRVPGDWRAPTLLVVIAIVALEFALLFWLASYLTDDVGLSRRAAALMVSLLFGANLGGRLLASRLARRVSADRLLAGSIGLACVGMPALLAATGPAAAAAGLVVVGVGVGAMFPLTSSLHVGASPRDADGAIGQVLSAAAIGQIAGPLVVAGVAQASDLRAGLLALPVLAVLAAGGLAWHRRAAGRLADGARTS